MLKSTNTASGLWTIIKYELYSVKIWTAKLLLSYKSMISNFLKQWWVGEKNSTKKTPFYSATLCEILISLETAKLLNQWSWSLFIILTHDSQNDLTLPIKILWHLRFFYENNTCISNKWVFSDVIKSFIQECNWNSPINIGCC